MSLAYASMYVLKHLNALTMRDALHENSVGTIAIKGSLNYCMPHNLSEKSLYLVL